jgi:uncharacterized LabA/DUF88 family protein
MDFVKFAELFYPNDDLVAVKYFTASPVEEEKEARQSSLFKANKILNKDRFQIIKGKHTKKKIRCRSTCKENFWTYEEKRTDVNISVQMMGDCAFDKTDVIVLISADSDLIPTIEFIKENYPSKKVKVYFPPCRKSNDLIDTMNKTVVFLDKNIGKFQKSVMATTITIDEETVSIPSEWIYIG